MFKRFSLVFLVLGLFATAQASVFTRVNCGSGDATAQGEDASSLDCTGSASFPRVTLRTEGEASGSGAFASQFLNASVSLSTRGTTQLDCSGPSGCPFPGDYRLYASASVAVGLQFRFYAPEPEPYTLVFLNESNATGFGEINGGVCVIGSVFNCLGFNPYGSSSTLYYFTVRSGNPIELVYGANGFSDACYREDCSPFRSSNAAGQLQLRNVLRGSLTQYDPSAEVFDYTLTDVNKVPEPAPGALVALVLAGILKTARDSKRKSVNLRQVG